MNIRIDMSHNPVDDTKDTEELFSDVVRYAISVRSTVERVALELKIALLANDDEELVRAFREELHLTVMKSDLMEKWATGGRTLDYIPSLGECTTIVSMSEDMLDNIVSVLNTYNYIAKYTSYFYEVRNLKGTLIQAQGYQNQFIDATKKLRSAVSTDSK